MKRIIGACLLVVIMCWMCSIATAGRFAKDQWENCVLDCFWNGESYDCPSVATSAGGKQNPACCERRCDRRYTRPDPNRKVRPEDYGYTQDQWDCYQRFERLKKLNPGAVEYLNKAAYGACGNPRPRR
jgi:hypothetical protein